MRHQTVITAVAALSATILPATAQQRSGGLPAQPVSSGTPEAELHQQGEVDDSPAARRPGTHDHPLGLDVLVGAAVPVPEGQVFYQPADDGPPLDARPDAAPASPFAMQPRERDIHDRLYFNDRAEGTWVRGATYKALVSADGFTFFPFLGPEAPRNYPVAFQLVSATLAGTPLALTDSADPVRDGQRFVLGRGAVDVIYDVDLGQVEQSFAIDAAGANGDLVLVLDVSTDLTGVPHEGGFRFEGPHGSVSYGAATVFDGGGASAHVPAHLENGELRLTVPGTFLASATGEIVVDPIIHTFDVELFNTEQREPDVAYDRSTDQYTYVYEDYFVGDDRDIYRRTIDSNGVDVSQGYVDSSSEDWRDPEIASLNGEDVLLVVAARDASPGNEIVGVVFDADTFSASSVLVIGDNGTLTNNWSNGRPDVGGNSTTASGARFVVTWERRFSATQTLPRLRTVNGDATLGSTSFFQGGTNVQYTEVVVSESTGDPSSVNVWNIAYAKNDLSTGERAVIGGQLNATGSFVNGPSELETFASGSVEPRNLDVSEALDLNGFDPTYLVTYDDFSLSDRDVDLLVCRNASRFNTVDLTEREHGDITRNQNLTRLGTTREDFMVTYLEYDGSEWQVYLTCLDQIEFAELAISERRTHVGTAGGQFYGGAAIASRASGGFTTSRESGIGWIVSQAGSDTDCAGAVHFASNADSPAFQYCYGTPNSTGDRGFLRLEGDRSTTSIKTAVASSVPPFQFGLLFAASDMGYVPNIAGSPGTLCIGGVIGRYNSQITAASASGVATFTIDPTSIPTPTSTWSATAGTIYQWQFYHRDVHMGMSSFNYTNAVTILFN